MPAFAGMTKKYSNRLSNAPAFEAGWRRGGAITDRARPWISSSAYCARDMVSKLNIWSVIGL
jgi:hypothetical protein